MDMASKAILELFPELKEPIFTFDFPRRTEGYAYRCRVQFPGYISYHYSRHCDCCEPINLK